MIIVECPWCSAPAAIAESAVTDRFVCDECAVSAPIAPDGPRGLDLAA